jgi:hypothetical protein
MHTGSCLCGSIRFTVDDDLKIITNCHCQYCRLAHGSEFVPVAIITAEKLKFTSGSEYLAKYEVTNVHAFRYFCSNCGTRLYNHSSDFSMISLVIATLTDQTGLIPIANVNMESKNKNFEQLNGLPSFDKVPPIEELAKL